VFEELGSDFTLIAFDADDAVVACFETAAEARGVPLKIIRDSYDDGRTAYEAKLMLVRPDRYVAWLSDTVPARADEVIGRVVGAG
jgi:hypothetical protein